MSSASSFSFFFSHPVAEAINDGLVAAGKREGLNYGIPSVSFEFVSDVAQWCVLMLLVLAFLDYFFARTWRGRYFVLHTITNLIISISVLPDVFNVVTDPLGTLAQIHCWAFPTGACFAIHFYHMLAPGFTLYPVDWLHHVLMVVLGCPAIVAAQVGPIMNFNLFFICGVPGGIDYLMLALVKERIMLPLTEKKHNNTIQVWIRAPALVITAALCWVQLHIHGSLYGSVPLYLVGLRMFCIIIDYWNGLYFMQRVCGNFCVTKYKLQEEYNRPGSTVQEQKDVKGLANVKDLKKQVLEDDIDEHPVESVVPGMSRSVKMQRKKNEGFWNMVRARGGS